MPAPSAAMRCDRTAAWAALAGHYQAHGRDFDLSDAFARDPQRSAALSFDAPEVFADLSKNLLDAATLRFLVDLANECGVEAQRDAMLAGSATNTSEDRAVLHTALRAPPGAAPLGAEVQGVLGSMLEFAEDVRQRAGGATASGSRLRHVVNIGIGGSDLGPRMAVRALAELGAGGFRELLAGARAMDEHFARTPVARNVPMLLGLVDVWYRNFHRFTSRCIAPYSQALQRLPACLQQLEMESNGKRVDRSGEVLPYATSPVVWGEPGTNAQHAYFQMLHQGSDVVPVEFILVKEPAAGDPATAADFERQHRMLLANGLAQSQALMQGRAGGGEPHRHFPGNRPSTTLLLGRLTSRSLGALLALYEHRVFTSGAVWGINSFDQWGVELGKVLSAAVLRKLDDPAAPGGALDASTAGLLQRMA